MSADYTSDGKRRSYSTCADGLRAALAATGDSQAAGAPPDERCRYCGGRAHLPDLLPGECAGCVDLIDAHGAGEHATTRVGCPTCGGVE